MLVSELPKPSTALIATLERSASAPSITVTLACVPASRFRIAAHFGSGSTATTAFATCADQNGVTPIHAPMSTSTVSRSRYFPSASNVWVSHRPSASLR